MRFLICLYAVLAASIMIQVISLARGLRNRDRDNVTSWIQEIKGSQQNLVSEFQEVKCLYKEVEEPGIVGARL